MSTRVYDRVANIAVILAVVSAFVFERLGRFAWVGGLLGILAAVVAVVAYFINQSQATETTDDPVPQTNLLAHLPHHGVTISVKAAPVEAWAVHTGISHKVVLSEETRRTYEEALRTYEQARLLRRHYVTSYRMVTMNDLNAFRIKLEPSPADPFVERVCGIIDRLYSTQRELEFELSRNGSFIIRHAKQSSRSGFASAGSSTTVLASPDLPFPEKVN